MKHVIIGKMRMVLSVRCLMALALLLVPVTARAQATEPGAQNGSVYVIQPSDVLTVHVWQEEDLTRQIRVRPDGRISVPLVQDVVAAGRTAEQVKVEIETMLSEWVQEPLVTILIDEFRPYRVFVQGQVAGGGPVESAEPLTVIQALAQAGGFAEYADTDNIRIMRTRGSTTEVFRFHYDDFIRARNLSQNIVLQSGDTVVVP